jgi:hypothetical protein
MRVSHLLFVSSFFYVRNNYSTIWMKFYLSTKLPIVTPRRLRRQGVTGYVQLMNLIILIHSRVVTSYSIKHNFETVIKVLFYQI